MASASDNNLGSSEITFDISKNITSAKIDAIFSNGRKLKAVDKNERPYFIFLVGSPGVGKTYMLNKIFGKRLDNFYKVSVDSILERITPFRNATKQLYNILKKYPIDSNKQIDQNNPNVNFTRDDFTLLNFSSLYQTKKPFNKEISEKLKEKIPKALKLQEERKIAYDMHKLKLQDRPDEEKKQEGGDESITTISKNAIERAITNRYNIIYDTTLTEKFTKITDIMDVLENNINGGKYNIFVILVEAEGKDDDEKAKQIMERINERHKKMIRNERYIRTIRKSLIKNRRNDKGKIVKGFITTNREGWDNAKKFFKEEHGYDTNHHHYNSNDIHFLKPSIKELENVTNHNSINNILRKMNSTKKNKNNSTKKNKNRNNLASTLEKLSLNTSK